MQYLVFQLESRKHKNQKTLLSHRGDLPTFDFIGFDLERPEDTDKIRIQVECINISSS